MKTESPANDTTRRLTSPRIARSIMLGFIISLVAIVLPALLFYLWAMPTVRAAVVHYWWAPFSAAYTIGSMVWTVRAERALRKLRSEQTVLNWIYQDVRRDVDDVQGFLENGNTLREIKVIPLIRKAP